MSHYTLVIGAIVALALGTMISASKADMYGPRQQANGQCWIGGGINGISYLGACPQTAAATGATANARIARPATKKK